MAHRIEVGFKPGVKDAAGESTARRIGEDLKINVDSVRTVDVYTIDADLGEAELRTLGDNLFADPVIQKYSFTKPVASGFDWIIEVGFRPGVTDNVGKTSKEAIEDILRKKLGGDVYTSRQYLIEGKLTREQIDKIAGGLLANGLIERWDIKERKEWDPVNGMGVVLPIVKLKHEPVVKEIDLEVPDDELIRISREGVLALSLEEMKKIRNYYKDPKVKAERKKLGLGEKPTDVELEALAQTWSEHCKHKIFNALIKYTDENGKTQDINSVFKTYIRGSTEEISKKRKWLVSVFKDNAGVITFNKDWNVCMKVETHNAPSALDPYGGALTGIVGVNRDPLGTGIGARLIFNTDVFCFASPFYEKPLPPRLLHPKRVLEGVRKGVEHGGNKSGIPTVNGSLVFDERYLGKPLVYCGTGGLMPARVNGKPSHEKEVRPGDLAVMCGGRIGKDGIHGATFSSEELHEGSPATAVQIGDPITQKKMLDFIIEARDLGLYATLTDNGAGGLSSSIGEMAQLSGGCEMWLEKCPLKYAGLDPWEILLSEAQERMTVVVPKNKLDAFMELSKRRGVESTVVGQFTGDGKLHVKYGGKTVAYLDMEFLHEGVPQMKLTAKLQPAKKEEPKLEPPADLTETLEELLGRLNICSKEYIVRQYDHEVQGTSIVKPLEGVLNDGPSDAAVLRPLYDSFEGIVISHGICPRYSDIDTYHMAACAIDEGVRNAIAVGANPDYISGLDNFCWPDPLKSEKNPDGDHKLAQLVKANQALYDITTEYGVPCISGKDSMKIDYMIGNVKISGLPTLLFSVIAKIDDVRKATTMDFKEPGDLIYVLGLTKNELGGSEYYAAKGLIGSNVPKVDIKKAAKLYRALADAIKSGLVVSCHDCSDGGLGVAVAESAFAGGFGAEIDLAKIPHQGLDRDDQALFSESPSRFVVSVSPKNQKKFEDKMAGNDFAAVGAVGINNRLSINGLSGKRVVDGSLDSLKDAWQRTLRW
jgi:phosphoribosylformylglycinamidine synthase